jgi:hypothetical protein
VLALDLADPSLDLGDALEVPIQDIVQVPQCPAKWVVSGHVE